MDDLDRWTRVLPLGSGAFGQVHLAWDTADERWVALKRFTGQDELGLLRFVIESRIRVEHPHLVRTLAFRLVDDRAWLVTQLARGGSVRRLMDRAGPLPWGWVVDAVDQVLDALVTLHATGVVHRDLKPANLLLRDAGRTRPHLLVGDFGIATWRTVSMTGVGAAIGTPGYLAPEYLDGHQPSPRTDVFAVGVLAAELLAGRRLVHVSNASPDIPGEWIHSVPLPSEVPTRVAAVLARMADPLPSRRYADCAQAREALLTAAPVGVRGDLSTVDVPDLLSGLPPGWTVAGPDVGLRPPVSSLPGSTDNSGGLNSPAAKVSTPTEVVHNEDPRAQFVSAPTGTLDAGGRRPTGVEEFGPANAGSAAEPNAGEPGAPAASPASSPEASRAAAPSAASPAPPPAPSSKSTKARGSRAASLLVVALLLGGAGTLWWAANNRHVAGTAIAGEVLEPGESPSRWTPLPVEPCSRAELGRERDGADGTERCQRSPGADGGQHWVKQPPGGFPKSDPAGPFAGEACTAEGDTGYTPVGDRVACTRGAWQLVT